MSAGWLLKVMGRMSPITLWFDDEDLCAISELARKDGLTHHDFVMQLLRAALVKRIEDELDIERQFEQSSWEATIDLLERMTNS